MADQNNPSQQQPGTKPGQQNPMPGKPGQQQTGGNPTHQTGQPGSDKK